MLKGSNKKGINNHILLVSIFLNLVVGLFLVYNASSTYAFNNFGNSYYFLINQLIWVSLGTIIFFVIQKLPHSLIEKTIVPLYFISIFFLILVIIPSPFSNEVYGARRWVTLNPDGIFPSIPLFGRLTFQPSELIKLTVSLLLPLVFLTTKGKMSSNSIFKSALYFILPAILIVLEPNFKDALILVLIGGSILFCAGIQLKYFVYSIPVVLLIFSLFIFTSPYRMDRVKTYLGGQDNLDSSYHSYQLNVALGSGGITGIGVGKSRQKNEYLPEVVGDSIFAIFGEEFGFIGSVFLVSIVGFLFFSIYRSVLRAPNIYKKLVGVGVLTWFGSQAFLNMGSISGLIPLTGVPLPLISYGGSSLVFILTGLAFVHKFSLDK